MLKTTKGFTKNFRSSFWRGQSEGFTLAEVLITLGIIGVVAAITMPVISANIQKTVLKNQFKKFYSTVSNALAKTVDDIGGDTYCYYINRFGTASTTSGCTYFFEEFAKNLKVVKYCSNNAVSNGCIDSANIADVADVGCSGYSNSNINNNNPTYVLNDGSIISVYYDSAFGIYPTFLFDINGKKKPNIVGRDIFAIGIIKDTANNIKFNSGSVFACLQYDSNKIYFRNFSEILK